MNTEELITTKEVHYMTGLAIGTLAQHRWMRTGIPYYKIGYAVRYRVADVVQFVETRQKPVVLVTPPCPYPCEKQTPEPRKKAFAPFSLKFNTQEEADMLWEIVARTSRKNKKLARFADKLSNWFDTQVQFG